MISIHALLAESDSVCSSLVNISSTISIHALLAESDRVSQGDKFRQSHFYPRSPCGERLRGWTLNINGPIFLSTLSLRRATTMQIVIVVMHALFLSTLSLRRATACVPACVVGAPISIHALLAESDFYPPEKPLEIGISIHALLAESDTPVFITSETIMISIHALLAESDFLQNQIFIHHNLFLSTLSLRRATVCAVAQSPA